MSGLPAAHPFQTSVETIRAHHWRFFSDAYTGCAFNCQYCLYKGSGDYGRHVQPVIATGTLSPDMGILDIGTNTDPYQPIESTEKRTRAILRAASDLGVPLFVLTRGVLVERDTDVLAELAERGLVEVCISIITLSPELSRRLEPRAPLPAERLALVERLVSAGIPTTFHAAPLIPGLNSPVQLRELGRELGARSSSHVFCAMLGAQKAVWAPFYDTMEAAAADCYSLADFAAAYPRQIEFARSSATTCEIEMALPSLLELRAGVLESGSRFVSENYPYLTTAELTAGIYRWKLPTVYDMAAWVSVNGACGWTEFSSWYDAHRPGSARSSLVEQLWRSGELFMGTRLQRQVGSDGEVVYAPGTDVLTPPTSTLVARRGGDG